MDCVMADLMLALAMLLTGAPILCVIVAVAIEMRSE